MIALARAIAYAFFFFVELLARVFVYTLGGPHSGMAVMFLCEEAMEHLLPPPALDPRTDLRKVYLQEV